MFGQVCEFVRKHVNGGKASYLPLVSRKVRNNIQRTIQYGVQRLVRIGSTNDESNSEAGKVNVEPDREAGKVNVEPDREAGKVNVESNSEAGNINVGTENDVQVISILLELNYMLLIHLAQAHLDIRSMWYAVHTANMTKFNRGCHMEGKKLIKPRDFVPPDHILQSLVLIQRRSLKNMRHHLFLSNAKLKNSMLSDCKEFSTRLQSLGGFSWGQAIDPEHASKMILDEFAEMEETKDEHMVVDAIIDIMYYNFEQMSRTGLDILPLWNALHQANMEKGPVEMETFVCDDNVIESFYVSQIQTCKREPESGTGRAKSEFTKDFEPESGTGRAKSEFTKDFEPESGTGRAKSEFTKDFERGNEEKEAQDKMMSDRTSKSFVNSCVFPNKVRSFAFHVSLSGSVREEKDELAKNRKEKKMEEKLTPIGYVPRELCQEMYRLYFSKASSYPHPLYVFCVVTLLGKVSYFLTSSMEEEEESNTSIPSS